MPLGKVTPAELAELPEKTKKHPEVVKLFMEHDFMEAYAKHTDMRVADNPRGAVGNHLEWEEHGAIQGGFLIAEGLMPDHSLLEIGCGTGRLARQIVPYLDPGCYWGVDISRDALAFARQLAVEEGWSGKAPTFSEQWPNFQFDYLWAFSVLIHLPLEEVARVFSMARQRMSETSKFYFSYVPEKVTKRTGFKQFRCTMGDYRAAIESAGLRFQKVKTWPAQQRVGLATLK